ncbi:MAG: phosphate ABC transporter substrate-binding protein PstS [Lentisphaeria bacterium]
MRKRLCQIIGTLSLLATWLPGASAQSLTLTGAGASFPAPVYQVWTYNYSQSQSGVQVNYQSIGSGAGVNQIKVGTVDFAGTDNPLTQEQQDDAGLYQFPMLIGGVVLIANLPDVANQQLKLDPQTLADIYLGKIKGWNDPTIQALNPDLKLPRMQITVVHRSDSSGTSFIFTDYLSKVSPEWGKKVGAGSSVKWPTGIGGQKNPGVCNNVAKIRGSIGYTEYTYAVEAKLACVTLKNRAGKFLAPTQESFQASAANAEWDKAPGFYMVLTNQPGDQSWPISGVTYILLRRDLADQAKKSALRNYFHWCFTNGAASASQLNYVPIPVNLFDMIKNKIPGLQ